MIILILILLCVSTELVGQERNSSIIIVSEKAQLDIKDVNQGSPLYLEEINISHRKTLNPVFGLSTNLIYDVTYVPGYGLTSIPSFSLEYYPGRNKHFTFGADVEWPMWVHYDTHEFMQINNITLWTRCYFRSKVDRFRGFYMLLNANVGRYGIGFDEKGWIGEGFGASLGLGWKIPLGKSRMFVDLGLAAGAFYSRYDPYVYGNDATRWYYYDYIGDPDKFHKRNGVFIWAGPTRLYLSLGIDLFNRKK